MTSATYESARARSQACRLAAQERRLDDVDGAPGVLARRVGRWRVTVAEGPLPLLGADGSEIGVRMLVQLEHWPHEHPRGWRPVPCDPEVRVVNPPTAVRDGDTTTIDPAEALWDVLHRLVVPALTGD